MNRQVKRNSMDEVKYIDKINDIIDGETSTIIKLNEENLIIPTFSLDKNQFTKDKQLTQEDKYTLYEKVGLLKPVEYVGRLLKNRRYTQKQIENKLNEKYTLTKDELNQIIKCYKDLGLIDDLQYAIDYSNYKGNKYGKKIVVEKLKQKGVNECIIYNRDVQHSFQSYKELLVEFFTRKLKYKKFKSLYELKQYLIHQAYLKQYDKNEIDYALEQLEKEVDLNQYILDQEQKNSRLILDAEKLYRNLQHETSSVKKKNKFYSKLKAMGYSVSEINSVVEERGIKFDD